MFRHFKGEPLHIDYTGSVNPSASFHGLPSTGPSDARWISPSLILLLIPYAIKHRKRVLNDLRSLSINLVNMLSCDSQLVACDSGMGWMFMDDASGKMQLTCDGALGTQQKKDLLFFTSATNVKHPIKIQELI